PPSAPFPPRRNGVQARGLAGIVNYTNPLTVYPALTFPLQKWGMNVIAAANAFNERAVLQNWGQSCDPTLAFSDPSYEKFLSVWGPKGGSPPNAGPFADDGT